MNRRIGLHSGARSLLSELSALLHPLKEFFVLMVRTNPEPDDFVFIKQTERAIVNTHTNRVHRTPLTHELELLAWVTGIGHEEPIGNTRFLSDLIGESSISIPKTGMCE